ncbi:MAG TPA: UDP-N-acetylglucosamine 2-epimerase [Phycisphaerae bacterium]|jgi:UDP-N-acetylglucosamine 2-epimerase (non-hydrolysing)/GDP/UDP-N,N'-diacetylbacillosamine 2-epimerase (hydrolysing)|nr:UDP-N-acetylglucosamine 2-epimerase (hydrolyzing) [Phycisphaerae bacterium]HOB73479.1 UDP-N-acetylglucosamine 2-epimerase [Phycisphaerae bacterium]HOJ54087.1 UDP-N-acetylglucosamine 2-epimerase [Phycisphaerae bacterium]HOL25620.1 UDP-N-acetylglucosamine 2-epimerase [Phycisphaerae bacterium]HPP22743.1 UDP-N-acetylglucosamine 2-epimerase [Phycisphaerae bacterium]
MSRRRIAIVTGTRAEFGLLEPVLRAVTARPRLRAQLIVTGMHLLPKFGRTIDHIRKAGWRVDAAVPMQSGRDDARSEATALARGVAGIAQALDRLRSEIVVVLGDRIEAFAGACAAVTGRRVLAHIHGGDRGTGDIDDMLRNAITRLAHVHLVASRDAAERLRRMGEPPERIHKVGAPGLDDIRQFREKFREKAAETSAPLERPYALVIQHPLGRSGRRESATMRAILAGVEAHGLRAAIIYPNSDPGHDGIIQVIQRWKNRPGWRVFRSLPRGEYLRLASLAAVMVGNSSAGIIESASLGLNAVNIGPRQEGRLRCGPNVIDCGESSAEIRRAIAAALARPRPRPGRSVYGDGRAGEHIAAVLERLIISPRLMRKSLRY